MNRDEHNKMCKILLGKSFNVINCIIDEPVKKYGPSHRKFNHDRKFIEKMGTVGRDAQLATILHIWIDKNKKLQRFISRRIRVEKACKGIIKNEHGGLFDA